MGSLMAGWDSPVRDPKSVKYQQNRSFTKREIDAYWRSKKRIEEEHLMAILSWQEINQESKHKETGGRLQRSISLPLANKKQIFMSVDSETGLQKLIKKNGRWISSNWAFLNEPPVIAKEGFSYIYESQYHVSSFDYTDTDTNMQRRSVTA